MPDGTIKNDQDNKIDDIIKRVMDYRENKIKSAIDYIYKLFNEHPDIASAFLEDLLNAIRNKQKTIKEEKNEETLIAFLNQQLPKENKEELTLTIDADDEKLFGVLTKEEVKDVFRFILSQRDPDNLNVIIKYSPVGSYWSEHLENKFSSGVWEDALMRVAKEMLLRYHDISSELRGS
jgi:succinate dehydrogenase flavin-adding protein (antitoxin of CptAB toxin-antitoxin module)